MPKVVGIKLTDSEHESWRQWALTEGLTIPLWVRQKVNLQIQGQTQRPIGKLEEKVNQPVKVNHTLRRAMQKVNPVTVNPGVNLVEPQKVNLQPFQPPDPIQEPEWDTVIEVEFEQQGRTAVWGARTAFGETFRVSKPSDPKYKAAAREELRRQCEGMGGFEKAWKAMEAEVSA